MKKLSKINESTWGEMRKRSSGEVERKEDIIGNIQSLKPIDMGGSVLWADQNLIYDGEEIFTYDEANDLIYNSEWRLPTLKEVAELVDGHNIYYDSKYVYIDNPKKISFKKCGCGYPTFIIDENKCFYG